MYDELFPIKGYEGRYSITKDGKVWSLPGKSYNHRNGKWLKPEKTRMGYLQYTLTDSNKNQKRFRAHQLVALNFIENKYSKPEINHINGIKTDTRVENLEWVTKSENSKHAFKTGLNASCIAGVKRTNRLVTMETANEIRIHKKNNPHKTLNEISSFFKVSRNIVFDILRGNTYLK